MHEQQQFFGTKSKLLNYLLMRFFTLGVGDQPCNPNTWEAKARGLYEFNTSSRVTYLSIVSKKCYKQMFKLTYIEK